MRFLIRTFLALIAGIVMYAIAKYNIAVAIGMLTYLTIIKKD